MSVTDFECAIARSQINRYVAGDTLAGDVIQQLEDHLKLCAKCKKTLEDKKSSLMAMLSAPETVAQRPLSLPDESVEMATPYAFDETTQAPGAKQVLRRQLEEKQREIIAGHEPIAAFAYKNAEPVEPTEAAPLKVVRATKAAKPAKAPKPAASDKASKFGLQSFALFKKVDASEVDTDTPAPKLTKENLHAAKQQMAKQKGGFTKPMVYLAGLIAVSGAMAFFLKDPTALFGSKATAPDLLVKKSSAAKVSDPAKGSGEEKKPVAKVRRSPDKKANPAADKWRSVRDKEKGTASQAFAAPKATPKTATKPKVSIVKTVDIEPKVAIAPVTKKATPEKAPAKRKPKVAAHVEESTNSKPKASTKRRVKTTSATSKPKAKPAQDEGSITIYDPEAGN